MSSIPLRASIASILLSAVIAAPASAQRVTDVRGLHLGAALNATSIKLDETSFSDDDRDSGLGANIYAGYNFTKNLGLLLSATAALVNTDDTEDYTVAHLDLLGRVSFPGRSALVPYLELGVARLGVGYTPDGEDEVELEGTGITVGGGLNYFFTRRAALDLGFRYTMGEFGSAQIRDRDIETGDGVGFNTARLNLGIAFYP